MVVELASAKLNLALHVTGRRDDGYHLLDSLVCFAAIGDVVTLTPGPLSLTIDGPFAAALAADADNLCLRAARLVQGQAEIRLSKNLPVASGIGGGSADAAAVLRGFGKMGRPLPVDTQRLGADVPVCVQSCTTRMMGIGEVLLPVPPLPQLHFVLVNPGIAVSTPAIFSGLSRRDNAPLPEMSAWRSMDDLVCWLAMTRNDLEAPAIAVAPVIGQVLAALSSQGARFSRMSGSGATCFGLFDNAMSANHAALSLKRNGWWAVATELASHLGPS